MNRRSVSCTAAIQLLAAVLAIGLAPLQAQVNTVVFSDDFSSGTLDPAKYEADAPFFEGGVGDIHAQAKDGVVEFVGATTQQWWAGATLRVVPTFNASESAPLTVSIDRVAEAGVGTASRSALWLMDETKTKYVLFADVRGEGGWHYNRKIGEDGDVATGGGNNMAAFDAGTYDDGLLHSMKAVANGQTVKLYVDGVEGAEVKFPFNKIVVEFGSYARANGDTAGTKWDNLKIETAKSTSVVLSDDFSANKIDPAKYAADSPFFEGGVGDIHAEAKNGVVEFVGTTTQQWWAGATLRVVPTYTASEETPVIVSIDRVAEAGVGTASRSALWIMDETLTKYVLFADVRGEGGWHYNRKIGEDGDVATGGGNNIAAFDGGTYDDAGLHKMKMVANGKTVKLILDGVEGAEVKFPYSKVVFEFGSYARANNDTAGTSWDNLKIETIVQEKQSAFADDFASNTIDPAKYKADSPFFEGGVGDIHAEAKNGVIEFVGTTTQQWWAGGTLEIVPRFSPSEQEVITLSIDRVAEAGVGTASRSALWVLDETKTKYVLFADVRGEGGWHYNRKIGEDGDVATGGGNNMAAFDGGTYDDGGLHRMSMIVDGKTVKLLLDGVQGAEVKFPFSPVVFEFGSYARANNDTASTLWDNLKIETAGSAAFIPAAVSVRKDQLSPEVTVRIPSGLNAQAPVQLKVTSSAPSIAAPEGGTGGTLTLTYPAGGANTATFRVRGLAFGGATFSIDGMSAANQLTVAVISGPAVLLEDNFAGAALDTSKWTKSDRGFESTGTGTFTAAPNAGVLELYGTTDTDYWPGVSVISKNSFVATKELNLVVDVDRTAGEDGGGTGARTGVYLTTADHSKYVFFAQNAGTSGNGWAVNVNPGTPTDNGTAIAAFNSSQNDGASHHIKLVADGSTVQIYLDGKSGGSVAFPVNSGIFVEVGAYARANTDSVVGRFDNVKVENVLPCTSVSPAIATMMINESAQTATVTIPQLLNDAAAATVTVTSRDPKVAVPGGATSGTLTLNFAAGSANSQSFSITPVGLGSTTFDVTTSPASCTTGSLKVEVINVPLVLATDDFSGSAIDTAKWTVDPTPLQEGGVATADSGVIVSNGAALFLVTCEAAPSVPVYPGFTLWTKATYSPTLTSPVTFELDRTKMEYVLVGGTDARQRTGVWIKDGAGHYVFFSEFGTWSTYPNGWQYHQSIGQADDVPIATAADGGTYMSAFNAAKYTDQKNHHMKMVANGSTVKLFLDGVLGAEVPFPFSNAITFGLGSYVNYGNSMQNIVRGYFDNVKISGGAAELPSKLAVAMQGAGVVISWTGAGSLEEATTVNGPWTAVAGAKSPYTVTGGAQMKFYRLKN